MQVRNGLIYLIPMVFSIVVPLVTLPVFTRFLTPTDYGVLALLQIYAQIVIGIANFGLTTGYERNFFEGRDDVSRSGLLFTTLAFVASSSFAFIFLTFVFRDPLSRAIVGSTEYGNLLLWSLISICLLRLNNYYLIYFKNSENARAWSICTITSTVLAATLSLFFVVGADLGLIGLIWGPLFAHGTMFVILSVHFSIRLPLLLDANSLRRSLRISLPLTPKILFGAISNQFDKYMIRLLNTVGEVGIYSIGQKISYIVFTLMTVVQNIYSPQVYKRMFELGEKGGRSVGEYLTPFLYVSVAFSLGISLFAEEVMFVLAPASYQGAVDIIAILAIVYSSYFFAKQPQLIYAKRTGINALLLLLSIGLNVAFNIPFIIRWGAIGAAWATLIAAVLSGTISFIVSQHYYRIEWEYKRIAMIYGVLILSTFSVMLSGAYEVVYWLRLLLKLVGLSAYLWIGVQIRVLTKGNLLMILEKLGFSKIVEGRL